MSIETFDLTKFESILPKQVSVTKLGLVQGEYAYLIHINEDIFIHLRSSIKSNGRSADTGQDSIRAWLVDSDNRPLGSKLQKWITRLPGWDERLLDTLRQLWKLAQFAGYCPECHIVMGVFKVRKNGPKKGKIFKKCRQCDGYFEWMEDK